MGRGLPLAAAPLEEDVGSDDEVEALARSTVSQFESYVKLNKKISPEVLGTIGQIEDGNLQRVLTVLRGLNAQYRPTREHRADYRALVDDATARMRGDVAIGKGSAWDASTFDWTTWGGYWESDSDFWVVIKTDGDALRVMRPTRIDVMKSVSISGNARTLKFREGEDFLHTLVLKNKYEATHESLDLGTQSVWRSDALHRLARATPQQKELTEQPDPPAKP